MSIVYLTSTEFLYILLLKLNPLECFPEDSGTLTFAPLGLKCILRLATSGDFFLNVALVYPSVTVASIVYFWRVT